MVGAEGGEDDVCLLADLFQGLSDLVGDLFLVREGFEQVDPIGTSVPNDQRRLTTKTRQHAFPTADLPPQTHLSILIQLPRQIQRTPMPNRTQPDKRHLIMHHARTRRPTERNRAARVWGFRALRVGRWFMGLKGFLEVSVE